MIIPDVNIMIYVHDGSSPYHEKARDWWEGTVNSGMAVGIPWLVALGFVRIVSGSRVVGSPIPVGLAMGAVDKWFENPNVTILDPGPQHWTLFKGFLESVHGGSNLVMDAHLAALAKEYRADLATNDHDFRRFTGIRLLFPVA